MQPALLAVLIVVVVLVITIFVLLGHLNWFSRELRTCSRENVSLHREIDRLQAKLNIGTAKCVEAASEIMSLAKEIGGVDEDDEDE